MDLLEYQAKELLKGYGLQFEKGVVVTKPEEVATALERFHGDLVAVKAQIRAGGRGKAGGIKLLRDPLEIETFAKALLGTRLATHQTTDAGAYVGALYLEKACAIEREFYLSFMLDRASKSIALVFSGRGGVEVESVSENDRHRCEIDTHLGIQSYHVQAVLNAFQLSDVYRFKVTKLLTALLDAFLSHDATLLEINPLVLTQEGNLRVLDVKLSIDDNARYRQNTYVTPDVHHDSSECEAEALGVSYVKLGGNIGCLVNGAGLAMATMDTLELAGGRTANFLDVGGSATSEMVKASIALILKDPSVEGLFVNIFGGIMQCDTIASALVEAQEEMAIGIPIVVRLEGRNKAEGMELLSRSSKAVYPAATLDAGVDCIVDLVKRGGQHERICQ